MKTIFKIIIITFSLLFISSCDTNDNNNPTVLCDAKFYTMASTHWDSFTGVYDIYQYQKSDVLSIPNSLSTGNSFMPTSGVLALMNSAINTNLGKIVYNFSETPDLYTFDINTNTVSTSTYPGGFHPEYLGNDLYFLKIENGINSGGFIQTGDCTIIDSQSTTISQLTNVDFSNSGTLSQHFIVSTSNNQDKIFYLANTKLIVYNKSTDTWNNFDLEVFNNTTNQVVYKGLEYVDNNTLYALRGNYTVATNATLELVKIDLSGSNPQVSAIKDLTNQLSVSSSSIINASSYLSSSYDICDDSYYFTYADVGAINSIIFEIKLISDVIKEYPVNGRILYGLDKD